MIVSLTKFDFFCLCPDIQNTFTIYSMKCICEMKNSKTECFICLQNETVSKWITNRSSLWEVFCKAGFLNFTKLPRKHLYWSVFFNKVSGLRPVTLLKWRLQHRYCPVNLIKLLRTFFIEYLWRFCTKDLFKVLNKSFFSFLVQLIQTLVFIS